MNQDLAEDIRCPVCLEIPKDHVFQCKDGHIICGECFFTVLTACPQCRLPYGTDKIRCRVLEKLLDSRKFECDYEEQGCLEKVSRDKLREHVEKCEFGPGGGTPLCRLIGFKDCIYKFNESNFQDVLEHLQNAHKIKESPHINDVLVMNFNRDPSTESSSLLLQWKDEAVAKDTPIWFLVLGAIHSEDESLFCALIQLNNVEKDDAGFEAQFQVGSGTVKTPKLGWKQFPTRLECLEDYLEMAPFRTKLKYLRERYTDEGGLLVKMSLLKISESTKPSVHYSTMIKPPIPPRQTSTLHLNKKISAAPISDLFPCIPSSSGKLSSVSVASGTSQSDQVGMGIEGCGNSSSMDAALMALFLYETSFNVCLFQYHKASLSATNVVINETRRVLVEEVVLPLQELKYLSIASGAMTKLRGLMEYLKPEFRSSQIHADEFVSALFGSVLFSNHFYNAGESVAGFVSQIPVDLTGPPSRNVNVQNWINENLRISQVPNPGFIVKMPFNNGKPTSSYVLPNLEISFGNCILDESGNPEKMLLSAVICREGDHYSVFVRTENGKYSPWIYLDSLIYPQVYKLPEFGRILDQWDKQLVIVKRDNDKFLFLQRTAYMCIYVPQTQ